MNFRNPQMFTDRKGLALERYMKWEKLGNYYSHY